MKILNVDSRWPAAALFWGSVWGAAEATAGYLIHLLKIPGLAGMVMFPIGVFFMLKAYQSCGRAKVIWLTALTASSIKLVNLAAPLSGPEAAFNPAAAILLESFAVMGILALVKKFPSAPPVPVYFSAALAWQGMFLAFIWLQQTLAGAAGILDTGGSGLLRFLGLNPLVNALFLTVVFHQFKSRLQKEGALFILRFPAVPALTFISAVILEWII